MAEPETRTNFLSSAIADIQDTIRAIDAKISYVLVALFLPVAGLDDMWEYFETHAASTSISVSRLCMAGAALFLLLWLLAFLSAIKVLLPADSPRVAGSKDRGRSAFFPRHLFRFTVVDVFVTPKTPAVDLKEHVAKLPRSDTEVHEQLAGEQTKLMYIAALKLHRGKWTYRLTTAWILVGLALWILLGVRPLN